MAKKTPSSETTQQSSKAAGLEAAKKFDKSGSASPADDKPAVKKAKSTDSVKDAVVKPATAKTAAPVVEAVALADKKAVGHVVKSQTEADPKQPAPKPELAVPSEAEFVASQAPLPLDINDEEVAMRALLHDVEAQFDFFLSASEAIAEDGVPAVVEVQASVPEFGQAQEFTPHPVQEQYLIPEPEHRYDGPSIPPMFIIQISPELAPVAKVGGLADVVYGLSNELEIRGNSVEIILPKYDCLRYDHIWGLCETFHDLWVPWFGGAVHCTVFFGFVHGRKCFFIEPHSSDNYFNRGSIYGFNDDVLRFAFFTRAAMEFIWKSGKNPEIIHCHDWQTALAPVFLFDIYQHLGLRHPRVCMTIHNFKHQGVTGGQVLQATGLNRPEYYYHYDRMRDNNNPHALNLMKTGVVYSNFVTTVSPRHASEAKDQGQGFGLEPTLHIHHSKYGGVVNGIDYAAWNPEIDPLIPVHYTADHVDGKYENKRALRQRLMLADNEKPIVAFVGRLDPQKGLELIRHAIYYTLQRGGQFVLLGSSPEAQINNYFWSLKHQLNENPDCHIEVGYNEELAHLIYAGSDMMVVPSQFEPCGLAQLIAMRYGSVPVVREVGGLADTVFDKDHSWKPLHERNGYVFRDYNEGGLESALGRAISCYYEFPEHFRDTLVNAMRSDYSWKNPGQDYLNIYDYIREK